MSHRALRLIPALLLFAAAGVCAAAEEPDFQLRAQAKDLPSYFPGYLGNGYVAALTGPRGTETTRSYLVAFMDYTSGDMSRPAVIPGWNEVDFSASPPGAGLQWLNRAPLNERHFDAWQQTLDMRAGTLTSSYRYLDRGRATAVEVTTLVSEAAPHLAATRFTITPDYDGVVHLSFPLMLWANHAPRFPLAEMTGPEMEQAVAANGLTLEPRPPATPDREAVWYPGYTEVTASDGDAATLSLWVDGKAAQGLTMGLAAAVALPEGATAETVTLERGRYRLALNVAFRVERGHRYAFTKFVALSRAGWGGNAAEDLALAREARKRGFERLLAEQRAAWDTLWQSDIQIEGDAQAQQAAHSELYYLIASSTADSGWSPGPDALTPAYSAHVFWDSDTWMFPALLLLHPERAKSMVAFRERTLGAAEQRAKQHGFAGAMFPWESDPENGSDQTPHSAVVLADTEIHVNADVAIAQWQYYLASGDRDWLHAHGWPVIRDVARFWASRATYDAPRKRYDIAHVTSVAESYNDIPNDTFTNVSAARVLEIATAAAKLVGEPADPQWERIAKLLYIHMAKDGSHHLPFDPSVATHGGSDFGGGPLTLLFLPSLDLSASRALIDGDYAFAVRPVPVARAGSGSMNLVSRTAAADMSGNGADAAAWFAANFTGGTLKPPFNVRTETADNNVGYFLTGSGGYIQSLLYAFTGLRIREAGLVEAYPPVLPATWNSLTLRNIVFRGQHLDIRVARDPSGNVKLSRQTR
jgi:hypothetical protein